MMDAASSLSVEKVLLHVTETKRRNEASVETPKKYVYIYLDEIQNEYFSKKIPSYRHGCFSQYSEMDLPRSSTVQGILRIRGWKIGLPNKKGQDIVPTECIFLVISPEIMLLFSLVMLVSDPVS